MNNTINKNIKINNLNRNILTFFLRKCHYKKIEIKNKYEYNCK